MGRVKRGNKGRAPGRGGDGSQGIATSMEDSESLNDEINTLRAENNSLKAKLVALENEIRNLRNENIVLRSENEDLLPNTDGRLLQTQSRKVNHQAKILTEIHILTDVDVLAAGLSYCGFDKRRQERVILDRNLRRFKSFFGVPPTTVVPILKDLKDNNRSLTYKDSLMALNWLYLYSTQEVLSGQWGLSENEIGIRVVRYGKEIQKLKQKKISFKFHVVGMFLATLDTCTFEVQEFGLNPSAENHDHKSNSCGLKYETVVAIEEPKQVWLNGPFTASTPDITAFRGGTVKKGVANKGRDEWDKDALYFQIPEGERLIGDGGYAGEPKKIIINSREYPKEMRTWISQALARHETLHTRMKSFNILGHRFRHGKSTEHKKELHKMAVESVATIIQYDSENGHPPFDV